MATTDYARVERAILFLDEHRPRQPSLAEAARAVHLSEYHFQRLFRRWAGISPKRFLQYLTVEHAKTRLAASDSVLAAAYDAGLSGTGRLHDLFVTLEAVTPGEYRRGGSGLRIGYGIHDTPFGPCLVAATPRGICTLSFLADGGEAAAIGELRRRWPGADVRHAPERTAGLASAAFGGGGADGPLPLHVRGTNFQVRVWEALIRVPPGALVSYEALAGAAGRPDTARATAGAVAANPVAYVIPCHRVIRKLGVIGGYRWGAARKQAMIGWEAAQSDPAAAARN
jgi:AraC family transcriptional regulator, regulatory protein of adaptative response / methylated-DNA-[protein]-cysteine methyltransferase